jgi:septal ring factor EnvC (AmiA/AmiB activator)
MKLCDGGSNHTHDEVCFPDDYKCPVCNVMDDLEETINELKQAEKDVDALEKQLEEVSAELSDLQAEVREERKNDPSLP